MDAKLTLNGHGHGHVTYT